MTGVVKSDSPFSRRGLPRGTAIKNQVVAQEFGRGLPLIRDGR
jgi:hypothetical protein